MIEEKTNAVRQSKYKISYNLFKISVIVKLQIKLSVKVVYFIFFFFFKRVLLNLFQLDGGHVDQHVVWFHTNV